MIKRKREQEGGAANWGVVWGVGMLRTYAPSWYWYWWWVVSLRGNGVRNFERTLRGAGFGGNVDAEDAFGDRDASFVHVPDDQDGECMSA